MDEFNFDSPRNWCDIVKDIVAMEMRQPRKNFFFIFYSEWAGAYWVVPSFERVKLAKPMGSG